MIRTRAEMRARYARPVCTGPLFPDLEPCGCPRGQGHRCDPPFGRQNR